MIWILSRTGASNVIIGRQKLLYIEHLIDQYLFDGTHFGAADPAEWTGLGGVDSELCNLLLESESRKASQPVLNTRFKNGSELPRKGEKGRHTISRYVHGQIWYIGFLAPAAEAKSSRGPQFRCKNLLPSLQAYIRNV